MLLSYTQRCLVELLHEYMCKGKILVKIEAFVLENIGFSVSHTPVHSAY